MANEIKKHTSSEHFVELLKREKISAAGVEDVISFSEDKIELKTNMGRLIIKGKCLNINKLDTENGKLDASGEIRTLEYTDKKDKGNLMSSLFN